MVPTFPSHGPILGGFAGAIVAAAPLARADVEPPRDVNDDFPESNDLAGRDGSNRRPGLAAADPATHGGT
jgi:hypothetical protein